MLYAERLWMERYMRQRRITDRGWAVYTQRYFRRVIIQDVAGRNLGGRNLEGRIVWDGSPSRYS